MKVGFVGLGKLGLPVALAVESKGHKVYGFDIKKEIYEQIRKRKIDYKEKHANDLLKKTKIEIVELKKLIRLSDIIFVPIQTPHDKKYEGINDIPKTRKDFPIWNIWISVFHTFSKYIICLCSQYFNSLWM